MSVKHANLTGVGLNCALGPAQLSKHAAALALSAEAPIWVYPNAGLPNEMGKYTQGAKAFAHALKRCFGVASAVGGCCGSTPEHISELKALKPKSASRKKLRQPLAVCGTDLVLAPTTGLCKVSERANVAGSSRFKTLIARKNYSEALEVVRAQAGGGAHAIDVNFDDAMLDPKAEMCRFLSLLAAEPDLAKMPVVIDSSS